MSIPTVPRRRFLVVAGASTLAPLGAVPSGLSPILAAASPSPVAAFDREFRRKMTDIDALRRRLGNSNATDDALTLLYAAAWEALDGVHATPPASLGEVITKLGWLADEDLGIEDNDGEIQSLRQCVAWLESRRAGL